MPAPVSRRQFLVLTIGTAALAACSSQGSAGSSALGSSAGGSGVGQPARAGGKGKETAALVVGLTAGGISNDPAKLATIEDWTTWQQMYNGLVRYKPGGFDIEPDLAESWTVSDDGKTYTFKLRQGVQFHRGFGELTSQDVKFSFDRNNDPAVKSTNRGFLSMLERVEAPDKYAVVFTLKQPYAPFLSLVALGRPGTGVILSKAAADKLGNDNYTQHPIGTGPFVFESEVPNQSRTLSRNDQYYEGPAYAKSLTLTNTADETTLSQAIEKGEVHLGSAQSADIFEKYKKSAAAQFLIDPSFNMTGIFLNVTKPPFDRVEVRQALAFCINQKEIIDGALAGVATPANAGLLTPGMLGYDDAIKPPSYDPAKAKDLLASAGVNSLKMTWPVYTGSVWTNVGALLKEHFRKAGIDLSVVQIEHATLNQRRSEKTNDGTIFSNTTNPEPEAMLRYLTSAQLPPGANWSWYTGIDGAIDQAEQSVNKDDRAAIVKRAQAQLAKDMPMLPLFHQQRTVLAGNSLRGYQADPLGGFWLRQMWLA